jgi:Fur family ferric uptake transcriptional regulator/Fur family peroxide stress response transcriptional regulator
MPPAAAPGPDVLLTAALRGRGQRVTSQRLVIHRALLELGRHASAEHVLEMVRERLPGISLPTVYATLDLFGELGLARRITAAGAPVLYDPRLDAHQHLLCRRCGRVEDIEAPLDASAAIAAARRQGCAPDGAELVLSGLCTNCASKAA